MRNVSIWKFFTPIVAQTAIQAACHVARGQEAIRERLTQEAFRIVIVVPCSDGSLRPQVLHEASVGERKNRNTTDDDVIRGKALQFWHDPTAINNCVVHTISGIKRDGVAVVCEGVQPHFGHMVAGIVLSVMEGLALDERQKIEK
jgi:hypothetical protein